MVQRVDMELRPLAQFLDGQVGVLDVPAHRLVRAVDLRSDPRLRRSPRTRRASPPRSRTGTLLGTAPIAVGDPAAPLADIDNLKAALAGANAAGAFLSAASPGVISLFFRNDHYANRRQTAGAQPAAGVCEDKGEDADCRAIKTGAPRDGMSTPEVVPLSAIIRRFRVANATSTSSPGR
jgi:hypothetical protein